jgi:hypothetical protein
LIGAPASNESVTLPVAGSMASTRPVPVPVPVPSAT